MLSTIILVGLAAFAVSSIMSIVSALRQKITACKRWVLISIACFVIVVLASLQVGRL